MPQPPSVCHSSDLHLPTPAPPRWTSILFSAGVYIVIGFAALGLDVPVARRVAAGGVPGELEHLLARAEVFGHAYGALAVCITAMLLDPRGWRAARCLLAASLGSGLLADILKLGLPRFRPHVFDLSRAAADSFLVKDLWSGHAAWNLLADSGRQSCPSAHTAVAVGLACGLAWLYPRARWWFALLAALCAASRVVMGAHFVSDVMWGAAVGICGAAIAFRLNRALERRAAAAGFTGPAPQHRTASAGSSSATHLSVR